MTKFVTLPGYGVNSSDVMVNVDHVSDLKGISFNGNHGTEISMVEGRTLQVGEFMLDVRNALDGPPDPEVVERLKRVITERDEKLDEYSDHVAKCHRRLREIAEGFLGAEDRKYVIEFIEAYGSILK